MATRKTTPKTQLVTRGPKPVGMLTQLADGTTEAVTTTLGAVSTTLSVGAKSLEIVDIKLDAIKMEAWTDLMETKAESIATLISMGMSQEDILASYKEHGFK